MEKIDLSEKIMDRIEKEQIKMRPKVFFAAISAALGSALVFSLFINFILTNVTIFKLRIYGPLEFLAFGSAGVEGFKGSIPWTIMSTAILFFITSIFILKKYDISYKKNFRNIILGLLILVIGGAFGLDSTSINEKIKKSGQVQVLYYGTFISDTWLTGEVEKIDLEKRELLVHIPYSNKDIIVQWSDQTAFPKGSEFAKESYIKAIGRLEGDVFYASGITPANPLPY